MNEASRAFLRAYFGDDLSGVYVCDSNKVTHFSEVNGPESNVVDMGNFRPA